MERLRRPVMRARRNWTHLKASNLPRPPAFRDGRLFNYRHTIPAGWRRCDIGDSDATTRFAYWMWSERLFRNERDC